MINILMVNKLFHPVVGGIEITITQLCEGLAKNHNFNVSVLASNEINFQKTKKYNWENATIHKLFSLGVLFSTPISLYFPLALRKLIKENDVIHFHVPNPIGELFFLINKIPNNKKVIVTVHADVAQTQRKLFAPAYNYFLKKLLNRADVITTSAPQNTKGFAVLKNHQQKCISIPLAYDSLHVRNISLEKKMLFKEQFNLDNTQKTILFVGRLVYYKGLSYLIDAIKTLANVQLVIVGDGNLASPLQQQVKKLELTDRVFFTGKLSDEMLATAYSIADVFVLPSITQAETFGIVQAEAMAYGLPIINTELNTGVNFVSVNNETGITVPPNSSIALKEAINKILENEKLKQTFSANALKRSILFSKENMVAAFNKIYVA